MRPLVPFLVLLIAAVPLAGCIGDGEDVPSVTDETTVVLPDGVWTVGPGTWDLAKDPFSAATVLTGFGGAEPSIGVTSKGNLFMAAGTSVIVSKDGGASWSRSDTHPTTLDPMLWVDKETDRIFFDSLYVGCSYRSYSDDEGASWTDLPASCGLPGIDHQKLGSGPWTDAVPATLQQYPVAVYYCYNKIVSANCATSYDGGVTFAHDMPVSLSDPSDLACVDPLGCVPVETDGCGGATTNPATAPDGTVYVGITWYCGEPTVAVSKDNGLTWVQRKFARDVGGIGIDPDMTVTPDGTAYMMWRGADSMPYLARSSDDFATSEGPWMLAPENVSSTRFTVINSGDDGRIAFAFLGTESGYEGRPVDAPDNTTWNLYMGLSLDAGADEPTFTVVRATPLDDPVQRGYMWEGGGGDPGRNLLDFIDLSVGPDGRAYVAYADGCVSNACLAEGGEPKDSRSRATAVGLFLEGPSLFADAEALVAPEAFRSTADGDA